MSTIACPVRLFLVMCTIKSLASTGRITTALEVSIVAY